MLWGGVFPKVQFLFANGCYRCESLSPRSLISALPMASAALRVRAALRPTSSPTNTDQTPAFAHHPSSFVHLVPQRVQRSFVAAQPGLGSPQLPQKEKGELAKALGSTLTTWVCRGLPTSTRLWV